MTDAFSADRVMSKLTEFQRNSVLHAVDRLYSPDGVDRFLVADQTGLGKTMVARGVIAHAIERLQYDPAVDRIDVVYVCSNADLAQQNLRKLDVTAGSSHAIASRLTLLAKHSRRFSPINVDGPRSVNLVSFTPGTSFSQGFRSGKAEERAMVWLLMEHAEELGPPSASRDKAVYEVLRGTVTDAERFGSYVDGLRWELGDSLDEEIRAAFLAAMRRSVDGAPSLMERMVRAIDRSEWEERQALIGDLRAALARESVCLLTPDLIVLDEFQRFRDLLNPESEAGELAHHLFDYRNGENGEGDRAKVLMLSATPFKPFTYEEERLNGEDHYRDFLEVLEFLGNGNPTRPAERIQRALAEYRDALVTGQPPAGLAERVREEMLQVMVRTERPSSEEAALAVEIHGRIPSPAAVDITGYAALKQLAWLVGAPMSVGYWKAVPYFVNFMGGYKILERTRQALTDPALAAETSRVLLQTQRLDKRAIDALRPLAMGNSRMQHVHDLTVGKGWAQLLWLPPSLPYLAPGGPYKRLTDVTKLLIFSSWSATPTAVATLLSYEANRMAMGKAYTRLSPEKRERDRLTRTGRLRFRLNATDGRPDSMSTFALFWPMPGLARAGDPRAAARRTGGDAVDPDALRAEISAGLRDSHANDRSGDKPATFWFEAFRRQDSFPAGVDETTAKEFFSQTERSTEQSTSGSDGVQAHVEMAFAVRGTSQERPVPAAVLATIAQVAANSPGNIAYRALARLRSDGDDITDVGLWHAAVELSLGLRSLFSRPESSRLLERLRMRGARFYWRRILQYCEWGNLQAVMDEYIHHLAVAEGGVSNDDKLLTVARAAVEAITLRPSTYQLFDPDDPEHTFSMNTRFAVRFGSRDERAQDNARMPQVRQSFNSPFWPFVLASTSIGQEGVDLHWWSHSLLHWNTPSNPVDFEQREGRVDRYQGHAVRKNIGEHHGREMLASECDDPWDAGYELAASARPELGSFAPHWVYPGRAKIERHVAPFPLSIERELLDSIKKKVALYRLTFGQPRQEDMLELVSKKLVGVTQEELAAMRLDLSAPPAEGHVDDPVSD